MKQLYVGIDLHSNNNYLAIIDEQDKRIYKHRWPNEADIVLAELEPFKESIVGIVVESTFNWYWLVDILMDEGYKLHLANPTAIQKYKGLKYSDDNRDAFWLAHLLRLGILPEGYIYPKAERPIRDLLRKRGHLVKLRTSLINSLQGIIYRNYGYKLNANKIMQSKENHVVPILSGQYHLGGCPRMLFSLISALFFENNARNTRCMSVLIFKKCLDLRKNIYSRTSS